MTRRTTGSLWLRAGIMSLVVMAGAWAGDDPDRTANTVSGLAPFGAGPAPGPPWQKDWLPYQKVPHTEFALREVDGRKALELRAHSSFGNLTHSFAPPGRAGKLSWSWRVGRFAAGADLRQKRGDDNAVKVCALFDLSLDRIPWFERFLLKRARASSKRHLPGATVCYVWDTLLQIGTRVENPYSKRLRYFVLRQGMTDPNPWFDESRDLGQDFLEMFGRESKGVVPSLLAISIGADSDNTGSESLSWVAEVVHRP